MTAKSKKTGTKTADAKKPKQARTPKATKKSEAKPAPEAEASAAAETLATAETPATAPVGDAMPPVKQPKPAADKKSSAIDAAAKLLAETNQPMTCREMIDGMAAKGYWTSPGGKTPQATLYSAILREIATKGAEARFKKTERGKFALLS